MKTVYCHYGHLTKTTVVRVKRDNLHGNLITRFTGGRLHKKQRRCRFEHLCGGEGVSGNYSDDAIALSQYRFQLVPIRYRQSK